MHALQSKLDEIFDEGLERALLVTRVRTPSCMIGSVALGFEFFAEGRISLKDAHRA
jgi:hypothetical protein